MVLALEAWNRNTTTAWALSQYKDHLSRYGVFRYKDDMAVRPYCLYHYGDVTMGAIASQITSLTIVYSTVYSDADQRKHQSSASLAFEWGIHRGPVNSPHKWPVTRKMFPFDDVIMIMEIPALVRRHLYIETAPGACITLIWLERCCQILCKLGQPYCCAWCKNVKKDKLCKSLVSNESWWISLHCYDIL